MKNLRTYEEFNWRKGAAGVALGAALLGGGGATLPSCNRPLYNNPVGNSITWINNITDRNIEIRIEGADVIYLKRHDKPHTIKTKGNTVGKSYEIYSERGELLQTGIVENTNVIEVHW